MASPAPKRRWFHLSPDRFVISLLLGVCFLWLSERFQWFGFNQHKGWTVLIAVAVVGVAFIVMLIWWAAGLIFGWRFQFGIRSLLAFSLASSISVSWLAVEMRQARRQAEIIDETAKITDETDNPDGLFDLGGSLLYDWQFAGSQERWLDPPFPGPTWMRKLLGADFFSKIVWVNLTSSRVTDDGLKYVQGLTELEGLWLRNTKITDAGLEHLHGLSNIEELLLDKTLVTDTGLEYLKELTQLRVLGLSQTNVTDAGLEHLQGLTQLRKLSLQDTKVTDAGVNKLEKALPNCTIVR